MNEVIVIDSPAFKKWETMFETAVEISKDLGSANLRLNKEAWVSTEQAAAYCGLHINTIKRYKDEIGYSQKGDLRFKIANLENWMMKDYCKRSKLSIAK